MTHKRLNVSYRPLVRFVFGTNGNLEIERFLHFKSRNPETSKWTVGAVYERVNESGKCRIATVSPPARRGRCAL